MDDLSRKAAKAAKKHRHHHRHRNKIKEKANTSNSLSFKHRLGGHSLVSSKGLFPVHACFSEDNSVNGLFTSLRKSVNTMIRESRKTVDAVGSCGTMEWNGMPASSDLACESDVVMTARSLADDDPVVVADPVVVGAQAVGPGDFTSPNSNVMKEVSTESIAFSTAMREIRKILFIGYRVASANSTRIRQLCPCSRCGPLGTMIQPKPHGSSSPSKRRRVNEGGTTSGGQRHLMSSKWMHEAETYPNSVCICENGFDDLNDHMLMLLLPKPISTLFESDWTFLKCLIVKKLLKVWFIEYFTRQSSRTLVGTATTSPSSLLGGNRVSISSSGSARADQQAGSAGLMANLLPAVLKHPQSCGGGATSESPIRRHSSITSGGGNLGYSARMPLHLMTPRPTVERNTIGLSPAYGTKALKPIRSQTSMSNVDEQHGWHTSGCCNSDPRMSLSSTTTLSVGLPLALFYDTESVLYRKDIQNSLIRLLELMERAPFAQTPTIKSVIDAVERETSFFSLLLQLKESSAESACDTNNTARSSSKTPSPKGGGSLNLDHQTLGRCSLGSTTAVVPQLCCSSSPTSASSYRNNAKPLLSPSESAGHFVEGRSKMEELTFSGGGTRGSMGDELALHQSVHLLVAAPPCFSAPSGEQRGNLSLLFTFLGQVPDSRIPFSEPAVSQTSSGEGLNDTTPSTEKRRQPKLPRTTTTAAPGTDTNNNTIEVSASLEIAHNVAPIDQETIKQSSAEGAHSLPKKQHQPKPLIQNPESTKPTTDQQQQPRRNQLVALCPELNYDFLSSVLKEKATVNSSSEPTVVSPVAAPTDSSGNTAKQESPIPKGTTPEVVEESTTTTTIEDEKQEHSPPVVDIIVKNNSEEETRQQPEEKDNTTAGEPLVETTTTTTSQTGHEEEVKSKSQPEPNNNNSVSMTGGSVKDAGSGGGVCSPKCTDAATESNTGSDTGSTLMKPLVPKLQIQPSHSDSSKNGVRARPGNAPNFLTVRDQPPQPLLSPSSRIRDLCNFFESLSHRGGKPNEVSPSSVLVNGKETFRLPIIPSGGQHVVTYRDRKAEQGSPGTTFLANLIPKSIASLPKSQAQQPDDYTKTTRDDPFTLMYLETTSGWLHGISYSQWRTKFIPILLSQPQDSNEEWWLPLRVVHKQTHLSHGMSGTNPDVYYSDVSELELKKHCSENKCPGCSNSMRNGMSSYCYVLKVWLCPGCFGGPMFRTATELPFQFLQGSKISGDTTKICMSQRGFSFVDRCLTLLFPIRTFLDLIETCVTDTIRAKDLRSFLIQWHFLFNRVTETCADQRFIQMKSKCVNVARMWNDFLETLPASVVMSVHNDKHYGLLQYDSKTIDNLFNMSAYNANVFKDIWNKLAPLFEKHLLNCENCLSFSESCYVCSRHNARIKANGTSKSSINDELYCNALFPHFPILRTPVVQCCVCATFTHFTCKPDRCPVCLGSGTWNTLTVNDGVLESGFLLSKVASPIKRTSVTHKGSPIRFLH